jgi:hypothetical protein
MSGYHDYFNKHVDPVADIMKSNGSVGEASSSVTIMSGYGLDYRVIEVRSPAEAKGFFL